MDRVLFSSHVGIPFLENGTVELSTVELHTNLLRNPHGTNLNTKSGSFEGIENLRIMYDLLFCKKKKKQTNDKKFRKKIRKKIKILQQ